MGIAPWLRAGAAEEEGLPPRLPAQLETARPGVGPGRRGCLGSHGPPDAALDGGLRPAGGAADGQGAVQGEG